MFTIRKSLWNNFLSDKTDGNLSYVERCENLLIHLSNIFHAHHYLVMRVKSQLISQYGNVPGYLYDNLSIEKVRRKIDLCREFIDVFGLVDPGGSSDWWAATTYESVLVQLWINLILLIIFLLLFILQGLIVFSHLQSRLWK